MKDLLCSVATLILTSCTTQAVAQEPVRIEAGDESSLALSVAKEMLSRPKGLEYGAFLLCDKGTCWSSDFAYGNENSISSAENIRIYPKEQTDLIVAYIHVHPYSTNSRHNIEYLLNEVNKTPSFQDYLAAQFFADDGAVYQDFNLWIVGPDDVLRSYPLPKP